MLQTRLSWRLFSLFSHILYVVFSHYHLTQTDIIKIDYAQLARVCGMTNPRSASNAWSSIKKKLSVDMPPTPPKDAAAPTGQKRKADNPETAEGQETSAETVNAGGCDPVATAPPLAKRQRGGKPGGAAAAEHHCRSGLRDPFGSGPTQETESQTK
jgi:hypothetical protein